MNDVHFQYITSLYADNADRAEIKNKLERWLVEHVGREGSARTPLESFDWGWCWSLTTFDFGHSPNGIYFVREEDKTVFRLAFGIGGGRL